MKLHEMQYTEGARSNADMVPVTGKQPVKGIKGRKPAAAEVCV